MGKRELLLIVGFVLAGILVYRATAPPSPASESRLSVSRFLDHVRREIRGNQATAEAARTSVHQLDREVTDVWVRGISGHVAEIEVIGEDRSDLAADLRIVSRAYDDDEARQTLERTVLRTERTGASFAMVVTYPREGRQTTWLTVRMPAHLRLRVDSRPDTLTIRDVAAVEATNAGRETTVRNVADRVTVTHRGGTVTIQEAASVRITGRNSRVTLRAIRGDASVTLEQGGGLSASAIGGAVDIESRNAEIAIDGLGPSGNAVRVNATGGAVRIKDLESEARLDGRNTEFDVVMSGAAPVTISSHGEDVALTPPRAGCSLDVAVTDGRVMPDAAIEALRLAYSRTGSDAEVRASGALNGGGPTISIRATRGDVILRVPD